MKTWQWLFIAFVLFNTACGGHSDGGGGLFGGDDSKAVRDCRHVVTSEQLRAYNSRQAVYRLASAGAKVDCKVETNVNGNVSRIEAHGTDVVEVLPNLGFASFKKSEDSRSFVVSSWLKVPSDDDLKKIAAEVGVVPLSGTTAVRAGQSALPGYIRLGQGRLIGITGTHFSTADNKTILEMVLAPEDPQVAQELTRFFADFQNTHAGLEVLWYPRDAVFFRQVFAEGTGWTNLDGVEVLRSSLRDRVDGANREVQIDAISNAVEWKLDLARVNSALPELSTLADGEWQNPVIADNTASDLVMLLSYLVKVNPSHPRKPVLDAYERCAPYSYNMSAGLKTAVDFIAGRTWTPVQFEQILGLSQTIVSGFSGRSWEIAAKIAQQSGFDAGKAGFAAGLALELKNRDLISAYSGADAVVAGVYNKIAAGLSAANIKLYFQAFDAFRESLRADSTEAASAADKMILSGRLNQDSYQQFLNFMVWLKNSVSLNFSDAFEVASQLRSFDSATTGLFQAVYGWLTGTVSVYRSDAVTKAAKFLSAPDFNSESFGLLKDYYAWLTGTVSMYRTDALAEAETAFVSGGTDARSTVQSIRSLTDWYINKISVYRSEAFERAKRLVRTVKMAPQDVEMMKDYVAWLTDTVGIYRSDAATKGEAAFTGAHRMTQEALVALKGLTAWLINTAGQYRTTAFEKASELLFTTGLQPDQARLLQEAGSWLIDTVSIYRSDAAQKAEAYVVTKKMTKDKFSALKAEYQAQVAQGKYRTDALAAAEKMVLAVE